MVITYMASYGQRMTRHWALYNPTRRTADASIDEEAREGDALRRGVSISEQRSKATSPQR